MGRLHLYHQCLVVQQQVTLLYSCSWQTERPRGFMHACRYYKNILFLHNWRCKKRALSPVLWCETPVSQSTRSNRMYWSRFPKRIAKFSQPFTVSLFSIFQSRLEHIFSQMYIFICIYMYIYIYTHMHTKEESYCFDEQACSQSLVGFS